MGAMFAGSGGAGRRSWLRVAVAILALAVGCGRGVDATSSPEAVSGGHGHGDHDHDVDEGIDEDGAVDEGAGGEGMGAIFHGRDVDHRRAQRFRHELAATLASLDDAAERDAARGAAYAAIRAEYAGSEGRDSRVARATLSAIRTFLLVDQSARLDTAIVRDRAIQAGVRYEPNAEDLRIAALNDDGLFEPERIAAQAQVDADPPFIPTVLTPDLVTPPPPPPLPGVPR